MFWLAFGILAVVVLGFLANIALGLVDDYQFNKRTKNSLEQRERANKGYSLFPN